MHTLVEAAARGRVPSWARMSARRLDHVRRVAGLLDAWARKMELPEEERRRWVAAGMLHDLLKEAEPARLRKEVPPELRDLPDPVLHGPAAAERLRREGVEDEGILRAVAWHTLGHPELDRVGQAVYAADFLDPGRDLENEWRAGLRARLPEALEPVVREILQARVVHLIRQSRPIRHETVAFWNRLVGSEGWERAYGV